MTPHPLISPPLICPLLAQQASPIIGLIVCLLVIIVLALGYLAYTELQKEIRTLLGQIQQLQQGRDGVLQAVNNVQSNVQSNVRKVREINDNLTRLQIEAKLDQLTGRLHELDQRVGKSAQAVSGLYDAVEHLATAYDQQADELREQAEATPAVSATMPQLIQRLVDLEQRIYELQQASGVAANPPEPPPEFETWADQEGQEGDEPEADEPQGEEPEEGEPEGDQPGQAGSDPTLVGTPWMQPINALIGQTPPESGPDEAEPPEPPSEDSASLGRLIHLAQEIESLLLQPQHDAAHQAAASPTFQSAPVGDDPPFDDAPSQEPSDTPSLVRLVRDYWELLYRLAHLRLGVGNAPELDRSQPWLTSLEQMLDGLGLRLIERGADPGDYEVVEPSEQMPYRPVLYNTSRSEAVSLGRRPRMD